MKRSLSLLACFAWLAVATQAEPARKSPPAKGVDLEAAAKATAALYATVPAAPKLPASQNPPGPLAQKALSAIAPPAKPVRASSLLPAAEPAPTPVSIESISAVQQTETEVWAGLYLCEHAEKIILRPGAASDQVELQWKAQRWQLRRVDSRSGALRLEDPGARMVWIQLGNKSMLLDQRLGKRLLDECQHDIQVETAARMKNNPLPALFDTTGMGR